MGGSYDSPFFLTGAQMNMPALHPACAVWPDMPNAELDELAADIKERGQLDPITMLDGQILDGKNRWQACERVGVEPRTEEYRGDDPIRFVLSKNQHRRHMSYPERCFAAEALATLARGSNRYAGKVDASKEASKNISRVEAAKALNVGESGIDDARVIRRAGDAELIEQVKTGKLPIRATADKLRAAKKPKAKKPVQPKLTIVRPPPLSQLIPSNEEVGRPAEGSPLDEVFAWREKVGAKVPLYSTTGKELLNCHAVTEQSRTSILQLASERCCEADEFFERIDKMLNHVRKPESKAGEEIEFAKPARKILSGLEADIDKAIEKLLAYRAALTARSVPDSNPWSEVHRPGFKL